MLKLKQYPESINKGRDSYYLDSEELLEYDIKDIPNCYSNVYYWYCSGSYDGDGVMILESVKGFDLESLSHCSCRGPCAEISRSPKGQYRDLQEIIDDKALADEFEGWKFKRLAKWALTGEIDCI